MEGLTFKNCLTDMLDDLAWVDTRLNHFTKPPHKIMCESLIESHAKFMSKIKQTILMIELNELYPVLEDAQRSEADSTHGEASNH